MSYIKLYGSSCYGPQDIALPCTTIHLYQESAMPSKEMAQSFSPVEEGVLFFLFQSDLIFGQVLSNVQRDFFFCKMFRGFTWDIFFSCDPKVVHLKSKAIKMRRAGRGGGGAVVQAGMWDIHTGVPPTVVRVKHENELTSSNISCAFNVQRCFFTLLSSVSVMPSFSVTIFL